MFRAYSHHLVPAACSAATWPETYLVRRSSARVHAQLAAPVMCMSAIHSSFIARRGRISVPDRAWSPNPRSRITSRLHYATAPTCARSSGRSSAASGSLCAPIGRRHRGAASTRYASSKTAAHHQARPDRLTPAGQPERQVDRKNRKESEDLRRRDSRHAGDRSRGRRDLAICVPWNRAGRVLGWPLAR